MGRIRKTDRRRGVNKEDIRREAIKAEKQRRLEESKLELLTCTKCRDVTEHRFVSRTHSVCRTCGTRRGKPFGSMTCAQARNLASASKSIK